MSTMLLPAPPPAARPAGVEFKAVALLPRTVTETPTGMLVRESDVDPTRGRAWQRGRHAGMGRP